MASKPRGDRQTKNQQRMLRQYEARREVNATQGRRRRRDNLLAVAITIGVVALAGTAQFAYFNAGPGAIVPTPIASATPTSSAPTATNVGDVPDPSLAEGRAWSGTLTLNSIPLGVELDGAAAPQAVSVLIQAAEDGYYPGTTCHRMVRAETMQVLQCGSLDGTGATDPSFSFGPLENTPSDGFYPAGTIAMARVGGDAYSTGHQFFIVTADSTIPNDSAGGYTVVGRITSGIESLISQVMDQGTSDGSIDGSPAVPVAITGFTIR